MDPKNSNFFSNSLEHLVEGSDYRELTVQFTTLSRTCTAAILVGYIHFIISLVQTSKRVILCTEKNGLSLSVFYHCICDSRSFKPSSCYLPTFSLPYATVSKLCWLSEFYHKGIIM